MSTGSGPPESIPASEAGGTADRRRPTLVRYWCSYFKSDRHARRVAGFFTATAAAGWRHVLVCARPPDVPAWTAAVEQLGVEIVYHARARGNFDVHAVARVRALLRDVRCDVFHCDNTHTSPLIGAWLAGVRVRLWSKRSMEPAFEAGRRPSLRDRAAISLRVSCVLATQTLAVSEAVAAELRRKHIPAGRVRVMLNPLDARDPQQRTQGQARAALGVHPDDFLIVTIGRALRVKGWDVLLQAAAAAVPQIPNLRVMLVGSTESAEERPVRAELDAFARGALDERVRFTGHLSSIDDVLAAADVFVLPSRSEGFSLALVEAMRAGVPVIAARVGIAEAVIEPGRNGLLVGREDTAGLAQSLVRVASDPALRAALGSAARATSILPTPDEHAAELLALYTELLRRESGAPAQVTPA